MASGFPTHTQGKHGRVQERLKRRFQSEQILTSGQPSALQQQRNPIRIQEKYSHQPALS
jgi:hypothetical protein